MQNCSIVFEKMQFDKWYTLGDCDAEKSFTHVIEVERLDKTVEGLWNFFEKLKEDVVFQQW